MHVLQYLDTHLAVKFCAKKEHENENENGNVSDREERVLSFLCYL